MSVSYLVINRKPQIRSKATRASSHEETPKFIRWVVTKNGHQQFLPS